MKNRFLNSWAVVAFATSFGFVSGHAALAGSDHGVRIHRLIKPSPTSVAPKARAEKVPAKAARPDDGKRVIIVLDQDLYNRRDPGVTRPWSERRTVTFDRTHRLYQNPPGLYSSQIYRAFD